MRRAKRWLVGVLVGLGLGAGSQTERVVTIGLATDRATAPIPSTLFGIFFEDINFAADGEIYPERVKNRSFEFPDALMSWRRAAIDGARGRFDVTVDAPPSAGNLHYLRIKSEAGRYRVTNDGFRGIGVREHERYTFTVLARHRGAAPAGLVVELENSRNQPFASATIGGLTTEWRPYRATLEPAVTNAHARLRVLADEPGTLDLDMVSLFPEDTWAHRENGLRRDLWARLLPVATFNPRPGPVGRPSDSTTLKVLYGSAYRVLGPERRVERHAAALLVNDRQWAPQNPRRLTVGVPSR